MPITTLKRSVTGANHVRQQVRCQDAGKTLVFKDFTVMAVADGHGSARCPFSDTGSKIAVNVFCDGVLNVYRKQPGKTEFRRFFEEKGDKPFAKAIVQEWRRRVARAHAGKIRTKKASGSSENLDEIAMLYGSTLLGIVITKDFFYVFQIGDGNIIYIENGTLRELTMGEKMLGVETNSLALSAPWKYVCTKVYDTTEPRVVPNMFLLATDGFANSYLNQKEFYNPWHIDLQPLLEELCAKEFSSSFLTTKGVYSFPLETYFKNAKTVYSLYVPENKIINELGVFSPSEIIMNKDCAAYKGVASFISK